jgi:hypothetical protein
MSKNFKIQVHTLQIVRFEGYYVTYAPGTYMVDEWTLEQLPSATVLESAEQSSPEDEPEPEPEPAPEPAPEPPPPAPQPDEQPADPESAQDPVY